MKTLALVVLALISTYAQASELKLSPAELAGKKLSICRNLQASIVQVSQLANHHSLEATSEDASFFTRMQAELLQNFKQLQCESRLDQAAADHAALVAQCKAVNKEWDGIQAQLDEMAIAAFTRKIDEKKQAVLYARTESLRGRYSKLGCERALKK